MTPTPNTPNTPSRTIAAIRDHLAGLLEREPGSAAAVGKVLRLLAELEEEFATARAQADAPASRRGPRRTEVVSHYRVEAGLRGDRSAALAEHRCSGAQPFRCPWKIYEAVAHVLASADDGIGFEDLHAKVQKPLGKVPIYRVRMCLRFWEAAGVAEHWAKQFKPRAHAGSGAGGFAAQARRAWERAKKEPIVPQSRGQAHAHPRDRR